MKDDLLETSVYKPLVAALLAGIIATLLNIIYEVSYRTITGFSVSELINVSTLIFGTLLVFLIIGTVLAILIKYIRYGMIVYIVLFIILTLLCVRFALHVKRSDDLAITKDFHGLFLGIVLISGISACCLVPYLFKNSKSFL